MDEISNLNDPSSRIMKSPPKLLIVAVLIVFLGIAVGGYFYYRYQTNLPQNIVKKSQEEAKRLADEVGKFMLLPTDETPTIATVTDITKLNNQPFFKFARDGDKVLIYTKAQLAIVYNPSLHKIINVGPVNVGAQPNQAPQAKIAILNGTSIEGLAAKEQITIQNSFPGATIVKTGQANGTNYTKTIVVALNPLAKNAAQTLAERYNTTVTNLPSTESPQDGVDIIVFLGKERASVTNTASASSTPAPAKK